MNPSLVFALGGAALVAAGLVAATRRMAKVRRDYFGPPRRHHFTTACLDDLFGPKLSHYYVHAGGKNAAALEAGLFARPPLDAAGIPLVDYGSGVGRRYNPCVIADYGLESWERYLDGGAPRSRDIFLKQAEWLAAEQEQGKWRYRFDWQLRTRGLRSGWISAISQGKAISLLLRAGQETSDERFLRAARDGLEVFGVGIDQGGVAAAVDGGTWFEEYPNPEQPGHVLNGHIWALFGLWDAFRATGSEQARRWFDQGVAALEANVARYDTGYWVLYELLPEMPLVNSSYMHFQIDQLRVIAAITGKSSLGAVADRWEGYHRSALSFGRLILEGVRRRLRRACGPRPGECGCPFQRGAPPVAAAVPNRRRSI